MVNSNFIFIFAVANEGKGKTLEYSLQPTLFFIYKKNFKNNWLKILLCQNFDLSLHTKIRNK